MEKRIYLLNSLLWPKFWCPFYMRYIINLKNYNIKTFVFKLFQYIDRLFLLTTFLKFMYLTIKSTFIQKLIHSTHHIFCDGLPKEATWNRRYDLLLLKLYLPHMTQGVIHCGKCCFQLNWPFRNNHLKSGCDKILGKKMESEVWSL